MKILVVVDMQKDFVDGALGSKEAQAIVPNVCRKILSNKYGCIIATKDTHYDDYLSTLEGKKLPVPHCIMETEGWKINERVRKALEECSARYYPVHKTTFGKLNLADHIAYNLKYADQEIEEIEICGLCTDICVVSNALILRASYPNVPITISASCCAGVTPEKHKAALMVMESCQIDVVD